MSEDIIEQAFNDALEAPKAVDNEAVIEEAVTEELPKAEATEEALAEEALTPFPKKAVNAISRRDKQIAKLRAELQQAKAQPQQPTEPTPPKDTDFDNYEEFLRADERHKTTQEFQQKQQEQWRQQLQAKETEYMAQLVQSSDDKIDKAVEQYPELRSIIEENIDLLSNVPTAIEIPFRHLESPEAALFALGKEGRLEEVMSMSQEQASIVIAQAEIRGKQMLRPKPVTNAPKPPTKSIGAGKPSQRESVESLLKWVNS